MELWSESSKLVFFSVLVFDLHQGITLCQEVHIISVVTLLNNDIFRSVELNAQILDDKADWAPKFVINIFFLVFTYVATVSLNAETSYLVLTDRGA